MQVNLSRLGWPIFGICVLSVALLCLAILSQSATPIDQQTQPVINPTPPLRVAALGDMACAPDKPITDQTCQLPTVAKAINDWQPDAALLLGDLQYEKGDTGAFNQVFDKQWADLKSISYAVPGNHEYGTTDAKGYFDYWNDPSRSGPPGTGYYSFRLGKWHAVGLNSNCLQVGGCGQESPQGKWLAEDLKQNTTKCTLAFWHHPAFSSGHYNPGISETKQFWEQLEPAGVDVVLNGHDHLYERFSRQLANGTKDDLKGIRQFTVGSGGKTHYSFNELLANHEFGIDDQFGFLGLELRENSYKWKFLNSKGEVLDSGNNQCH